MLERAITCVLLLSLASTVQLSVTAASPAAAKGIQRALTLLDKRIGLLAGLKSEASTTRLRSQTPVTGMA